MQCFLTGATGFIGSAVAKRLLDKGHDVVGLTSSAEKTQLLEQRGIQPILGDMHHPEKWIPSVPNIDAIIHTATIPTPSRPGKRYLNNLLSAQQSVVQALIQLGESCRVFVYTSGLTVYGHGPEVRTETSEINPVEIARPYVLGEEMVMQAHREKDIPVMILRPAGVYGDGGIFGKYWTTPMKKGKRAPYPGNGKQVKSFVSIDDCAQAYLRAVENPMPGEAFNVADDDPVAFGTLFPYLADHLDAPKPFGIPALIFRIIAGKILAEMLLTDMVISNRKMKEKLGVSLKYPTYREGISALKKQIRQQ